jgi:hypothetical protein
MQEEKLDVIMRMYFYAVVINIWIMWGTKKISQYDEHIIGNNKHSRFKCTEWATRIPWAGLCSLVQVLNTSWNELDLVHSLFM